MVLVRAVDSRNERARVEKRCHSERLAARTRRSWSALRCRWNLTGYPESGVEWFVERSPVNESAPVVA